MENSTYFEKAFRILNKYEYYKIKDFDLHEDFPLIY